MHSIHSGEDEPMADMNLIPLIDVALTLLIIMMVTTVFIRKPGVNLTLPKTVTREGAPETSKDLTIVLSAAGEALVDGAAITDADLQTKLTALAERNRDSRVVVKGDGRVAYARIMDVMDMARQAGLAKITLPTDPKHANPVASP